MRQTRKPPRASGGNHHSTFFFVFHSLGAPNSYYRSSWIKGLLRTLLDHPFFEGFCTFRGDGVRRRIEGSGDEKVRKIVHRRSILGSTLPPAPPEFNVEWAFPRRAREALQLDVVLRHNIELGGCGGIDGIAESPRRCVTVSSPFNLLEP